MLNHALSLSTILAMTALSTQAMAQRARARDLGVKPGVFAPGRLNAITDVAGVRVGQTTVVQGDNVRTGVTAILPHGGNVFTDRVPAALHVGNGFGKITGATQLHELGELETPLLLTCTLCVWKAADAMVDWMLGLPGMANVRSINPVVAETNDGTLNDIRARPITAEQVRAALASASDGPVAEGSVGAGTGTVAFGWKGGIGTSSRLLPQVIGGWTVGELVQTHFGGVSRAERLDARPGAHRLHREWQAVHRGRTCRYRASRRTLRCRSFELSLHQGHRRPARRDAGATGDG